MTPEERIQICFKCKNRKMDMQRGIVCGLTNEKPDFDDSCPNIIEDIANKTSDANTTTVEYEFGGWLKFMFLMIFVGITMTVVNTFKEIGELQGDTFTSIFCILHCLSFLILGGYALYMFLTRKSNAVFWGYTYLVTCLISNIVSVVGNLDDSNIIILGIRAVVTCIAWFAFLYYSENVKDIYPPEKRKTTKKDWTLAILGVSLPYAYLLLAVLLSIGTAVISPEYDPTSMTEQYSSESGYYTDGIVAFKSPSHYIVEQVDSDGTIIFSLADSETEPSETITIVSELNYELTAEEFDEYYEAWKDEDFAYLTTTVVKDEENVIEGKHYRYRSVYFEEYGTYWDFVIVNQPDINKNCLVSIYTAEPGKRVFFFVRGLKFI